MIGHIYKIVHSQSDIVYVGMTFNSISTRWQQHKSAYKSFITGKTRSHANIYKYFNQYSIDQFKIMLIKDYDVIDRKHLMVYETLWINKLSCVNLLPSFNPMPEKMRERSRHARFRDKRNKLRKDHYYEHRDEVLKKNRESIMCSCGNTYTRSHKERHFKTKRHLLALQNA